MADEQDATLEQFLEELPISVRQIIRPLYSKKKRFETEKEYCEELGQKVAGLTKLLGRIKLHLWFL